MSDRNHIFSKELGSNMKYYIYQTLILSIFLIYPALLQADNHKWLINEIYSNSDGTIQFVELIDDGDDQGHLLAQTNLSTSISSYNFPNNLPTGISTANKAVLIATAGFAELAALQNGPQPDYIIPDNFLRIFGSTLVFSGSGDEVTYSTLPTDGINSINRNGSQSVNSPRNFANVSGTISPPTSGPDCNGNGIPDNSDIASGNSTDCNADEIPDECQLAGNDCNQNNLPDECEGDSDNDGVLDPCDGCPLDPTGSIDSDGDLVCDHADLCPGGDDRIDSDQDGIPDACDNCPLDPHNLANQSSPCWDGTNDECWGATVIGLGNSPVDNTAATSSFINVYPVDPAMCLSSELDTVGKDIWFSYTPPSHGFAIFSTCSLTTFDTDLVLYTGNCDNLTQVACNGDSASNCDNFTAEIQFPVAGLTRYLIRLGGWQGEQGTGHLNITFTSSNGGCAVTGDVDNDGVCDPDDACPGFSDALDADGDGIPDGCDSCPLDFENDIDGDGLCSDQDPCPLDSANDADQDGLCANEDPCPSFPLNDGPDFDGDLICDEADPDDDNDGVIDAEDLAPRNSNSCRDIDLDGCDDCANGFDDPLNDGVDSDGDGLCNLADDDDDNDGVADTADSSPLDPFQCGDVDMDGCEDCFSGISDTANDGADTDGDGLCDSGDPDLDGDGIENACDLDQTVGQDCNSDLILDDCQLSENDCDGNLVPDDCQVDSDGDTSPDTCDLDDDGDGVEDSADSAPLDPLLCRDSDGDGCDDCSSGIDDSSADGTDSDGDGLCDFGDADDDNDGVIDGEDAAPLDGSLCRDTDGDGCDDCSSGLDNPASDGLDTDADGICDLGDPDDDNDGVNDDVDIASTDPFVCGDSDSDGCDDCSSGTFNPQTDGIDTDGDGICDAADPDLDGDGILNECDLDQTAGLDCNGDLLDDSCQLAGNDCNLDGIPDECTLASDDCNSDQILDSCQLDTDSDGTIDSCDADDDGDGLEDALDSAPLDPFQCQDIDMDGCDDCSSGSLNAADDGADFDGDGLCDLGDTDDDDDGVADTSDSDSNNPFVCRDLDGDNCDDCSSGTDAPSADGSDFDNDGLCDLGDSDDDNDGVMDVLDEAPLNPAICRDTDADGCDDCSSGFDNPAADGVDSDGDGLCDSGDSDIDGDGIDNDCDTDLTGGNDCQFDNIDDSCQLAANDCNGDSIPDDCQLDTDSDGTIDSCDLDDDGDGVSDTEDSSSLDPFLCRDADADGCDDCVSGFDNPASDGADLDGDGLCDLGDPDDDGDGVSDGEDEAPNDNTLCRDVDADGCDDCSSGFDNPANDGLDSDGDGICDLNDGDIDGDGVLNSCDPDHSPGSDCNSNGAIDECDINTGVSQDCDLDGIPDSCQIAASAAADCDSDGQLDSCEIFDGLDDDCDGDGILDSCALSQGSPDCDLNGIPDSCDIANGALDTNFNQIPDTCEGTFFIRGDSNSDGQVDVTDGIVIIYSVFGMMAPPCGMAMDVNGDNMLNLADPMFLLQGIFTGEVQIPFPYPNCGPDLNSLLPCSITTNCP